MLIFVVNPGFADVRSAVVKNAICFPSIELFLNDLQNEEGKERKKRREKKRTEREERRVRREGKERECKKRVSPVCIYRW